MSYAIRQITNLSLLQQQINNVFASIFGGGVTLVPVTNGAEPPVFITDGAGGLIFISMAP